MIIYSHQFIDGAWRLSNSTDALDVVSSATEEVFGRVPRGNASDVDLAVTAARAAFDGVWGRATVAARVDWLEKLAVEMKTRVPAIAVAIAHEVGTAHGYATKVQAEFPVSMIGANARYIHEARLEEELGNSLIVKEPVGVVGCITPWNYPLHQVIL